MSIELIPEETKRFNKTFITSERELFDGVEETEEELNISYKDLIIRVDKSNNVIRSKDFFIKKTGKEELCWTFQSSENVRIFKDKLEKNSFTVYYKDEAFFHIIFEIKHGELVYSCIVGEFLF